MDRRGFTVMFVALMLAVVMVTPSSASAGIMQSPGSETGQPDAENNTLYLFGNQQLTMCDSKFNSTNADSASYGEKNSGSGSLDIKLTCRMDPSLDVDFALLDTEMIRTQFTIELGGEWVNGQSPCASDCENLNISLIKGNRIVAIKEFDTLSDGPNSIVWDIPVTEDLVYWNGSQETIAVEFTMKLKAVSGGLFGVGGEDAIFGLYFSHVENPPEQIPYVMFPILNQSAYEELNEEPSINNDEGGPLPGFGAIVGISGLAAAALLRNEDEE